MSEQVPTEVQAAVEHVKTAVEVHIAHLYGDDAMAFYAAIRDWADDRYLDLADAKADMND